MNRAERRRRARDDERLIARGIDPRSDDPEPVAAMARQLYEIFEAAKRDANVDAAMRYLYAKVDATIGGLKRTPVACRMGCSHCCYAWVSATAPEVLFIAKRLRRGADAQAAAARINAAHAHTSALDFASRVTDPYPCPMLEDDLCSIYDIRPRACRFAASGDAAACERLFRNGGPDEVPIPVLHIRARQAYWLALSMALRRAKLSYRSYEFNAALARAMERNNAERAWLAGEHVFEGIGQDPDDAFSDPARDLIYQRTFG